MTVVKGSENESFAQVDMLKYVLLIANSVGAPSSRYIEQCLRDIQALAQDTC